jgi:hypothetical protein
MPTVTAFLSGYAGTLGTAVDGHSVYRWLVDVDAVKAAFTVLLAVIAIVHVVAVPLHPPLLQPLNVEPLAGVAVSVTVVAEV